MSSWDEIKKKPEKLSSMVNEVGTRETGKRFGKNKDTVNHWLKKHGYEYNPDLQKWEKDEKINDNEFEQLLNSISSQNIHIKVKEDSYIIIKDDKRLKVSKEKLKNLYYDYCELNLTQEETAIKNDIIKPDFKIIKQAFDIIHDSLPLTNEQILDNSVEDNIMEVLKNKKRKIQEKKPIEELRHLRNIAEKYYEKYYQAQRIVEELEIEPISFSPSDYKVDPSPEKNDMLVTLADLHYGKQVLADMVMGVEEDFNTNTLERRLKKYQEDIIKNIKIHKPDKVYIVDLGDIADDPQAQTYPNQILNQDVTGADQILGCVELISDFILNIHQYHDNIKYIQLPGNHSADELNVDVLIGGMIEKLLESYKTIETEVVKKFYHYEKINEHNFIFSHGNHLSNSKYKRENNLLNIMRAMNLNGYTYFITGHKHHESDTGTSYEHKQVPSIVGNDSYSSERLNVNSRPAQMHFIVSESGLTGRRKTYFD